MAIKQQIIIFEGHDNSGKTILSTELSKILHIPRFKYTTTQNYFKTKYDFLLACYYDQSYFIEFLEQTKHSVIIDRSYPSEYVYSRVYDRPRDEKFLKELDKRFADLGAKIIILFKDTFTEEYKDDYVKISEIVSIKSSYMRFANDFTECDYLLLNTTKQDLKGDIRKIFDWLQKGNINE